MKNRALHASITRVQSMTGIVLWTTNEAVQTSPIQLEYSYFTYAEVVNEQGQYNWNAIDSLLDQVAKRGHQAILRFHDTYVGKKSGVPRYIAALADYKTTTGKSEGKSSVSICNQGIAPIYYDAFVAVDRIRASESLKGLLPGETRSFSIPAGGVSPSLSIECDRLIPGQIIEYEADLSD